MPSPTEGDDLADADTRSGRTRRHRGRRCGCCARLGEMARGEDHRSATTWSARSDKALANDLGALLG